MYRKLSKIEELQKQLREVEKELKQPINDGYYKASLVFKEAVLKRRIEYQKEFQKD